MIALTRQSFAHTFFPQSLFGIQDEKAKWQLSTALSAEQLAWWQGRMTSAIRMIKVKFPESRIVLRKLHRTDALESGTRYMTNCECPSPPLSHPTLLS